MTGLRLESASGLRPTAAFLGVSLVLLVVVGRAAALCLDHEHHQPRGVHHEEQPRPDFDVVDREGRLLALSVQSIDLRMSPRSMWQAHTPDYMAQRIAAALGPDVDPALVLDALLPDAVDGVVRPRGQRWVLDHAQAARLDEWVRETGLEGLWLERLERPGAHYALCWQPAVVLSRATREAQSHGRRPMGPLAWGRRFVDGLARALLGDAAEGGEGADQTRLREQRRRLWAGLLPSADHVVVTDLPPDAAERLAELLAAEGVADHQMQLDFHHAREYPLRRAARDPGSFEIVGGWRYMDELQARRAARRELGIADPRACGERQLALWKRRTDELLDRKHPAAGLERLASELLEQDEWAFLRSDTASYSFRIDRPVRSPARRYYFEDFLESETPRVVATIDAGLQAFARARLAETLDEHRAAVAMAIAVDVETGAVLAADGVAGREVAEFLPTWHLFTPGSTFKVVVMATALEAGVVTPKEPFDTYDANYRIPNSGRTIHEAEGPPTGVLPAELGLAHSVNAILVQIGMRVPDEYFHGKLSALGYGRAPGSGVGVERAGSIPDLPWKPAYSHASVSFGHEVALSLWQHAAALATVLRGGEYRPLRLLDAVEWSGSRSPAAGPPPVRVFSEDTCAKVRAMMTLGAEIGTGRHLFARVQESGAPLLFGSKTGTTEKVPSETCLHLELERNAHNAELSRDDPAFLTFDQMRARPKPHKRSCYTSSICLFGRTEDDPREVMVLVVVDEPRAKKKYGWEVAGPAAMAILEEALGLTRDGAPTWGADAREASVLDYGDETGLRDHPWAESAFGAEEAEGW